MEIKDAIKELAEKCLPGNEFFIVDIKVTGKANQQKVLITVDGDNGISIDDCAAISRTLGDMPELESILPGAFHLEISSPGADDVIKNNRQYNKNIGRRLEVINIDGELTIGQLKEINEEGIIIIPETNKKKTKNKEEKEELSSLIIPYSKIKKSNVIISFK